MIARGLWLALGLVSIALGVAGAVLPLLPTTPFLLLAAFAFARSSPRLHAWLTNHPRFGPLIDDWRRHGAIGRRTKRVTIAVMALMLTAGWLAGLSILLLGVQAAVLGCVAAFILTRPDTPCSSRLEN